MSSVMMANEGCGDSIKTRSIANSFGSSDQSKASSCKSISDPTILFSKAVLDLKRSARECEEEASLTEYWDAWNYWKRHPFVLQNALLSGQLLLEHLLILTNLHYDKPELVFTDLKAWLELTGTNDSSPEAIIQLRDQLCAGFFLIYCSKALGGAEEFLFQVKDLLALEYFDALHEEITRKASLAQSSTVLPLVSPSKVNQFLLFIQKILLNISEFARGILKKLETSHGLLVKLVQGNSKAFYQFCCKLLFIVLRRLKDIFIL